MKRNLFWWLWEIATLVILITSLSLFVFFLSQII
jgi:hypothetical protein